MSTMLLDLEALPPLAYDGRAERVASDLATAGGDDVGCDALLVTDLVNLRWLTGFTGSAGRLVVRPDSVVLVTDGRYAAQARRQLDEAGVVADVVEGRTREAQREILAGLLAGVGRIGLEAGSVTWGAARDYEALLDGVELVPTTGLVEAHRRRKDAGEIARIEAACDVADEALADVVALLSEGVSEVAFALALETAMRHHGADGPSFDTIVAAGPGAADPHHRPTHRPVAAGDLVILDYGALVDGYHSDMTRTFAIGEPSAEQQAMLDLVTTAQATGVAAVRPGMATTAVDAACRDVIAGAGWGEAFVHGTGHGVGLVIHEDPFLGLTSTGALEAGQVITVEPGVYRAGLGGVRVEDTVLVTSDGCRPLTKTSKDHPCLPSPRTT